MLKGIKIGQKYYCAIIMPDGCEAKEYINQNSNLEEAREKSGNYFATKQEAQSVSDKINKFLLSTKKGC